MIWLSPVLAKPAARATKENSGQHDMHMLHTKNCTWEPLSSGATRQCSFARSERHGSSNMNMCVRRRRLGLDAPRN